MTVDELRAALEDVPGDVQVIVNVGDPFEDLGTDTLYESVGVFSYNDALDHIEIFVPVDEHGNNIGMED
ncbi:hypothetical protein [Brevibacterium sp. CFH 10365]|uniref:hypothetical protein n=1 Tax=Brevibacterium sp. CFH 10365 TaxID=2585207 RepID=UPI0012663A32|nr:hypothetical protein [Brevibacterium sp. CFH 10365]